MFLLHRMLQRATIIFYRAYCRHLLRSQYGRISRQHSR
jgi:hypothetical protein